MPEVDTEDDDEVGATRRPPAGKEALVIAFPVNRAFIVPDIGERVGRDSLAPLGVDDAKLSRDHCGFYGDETNRRIIDKGSRNGTYLNGMRLAPNEPFALADGDVLRMGRTLMVYRDSLLGPHTAHRTTGGLVAPFGMRAVRAEIHLIARQKPKNILIEGETGTGKELVARELAEKLGRGHLYVPVNVAAFPANMFESMFFGHVKGAFSGADQASAGVLASHDGGAVFLDEIGELAINLQPKLLRLVENREIHPVGANKPRQVDLVLIAANNRSLKVQVEEGTFRQDLLMRLRSATLELPPLRERREDIFAIVLHRIMESGEELDPAQVDGEAVERLLLHPWTGNVRELRNTVDAIVGKGGLPALRVETVNALLGPRPAPAEPMTREVVESAIARADGNESQAARVLGISRQKLRRLTGRKS